MWLNILSDEVTKVEVLLLLVGSRLMSLQILLLRESHLAKATGKWPFSSVCPQMDLQSAVNVESFSTMFAFELSLVFWLDFLKKSITSVLLSLYLGSSLDQRLQSSSLAVFVSFH